MTKEYVLERWGVDVDRETESNPEISAAVSVNPANNDTMVTLIRCFYRNKKHGIGLFSWVNDTVIEDLEDYQARIVEACSKCGAVKPFDSETCACGSKSWKKQPQDYETLVHDVVLPDGRVIPALTPKLSGGIPVLDATGNPVMSPTRIPYYKPDVFPLVLRKNISVFGKLLGDSDVDKIQDQQERIKKLDTKIDEKLLKGGSFITLPRGISVKKDDTELKTIEVRSAQDTQAISVQTLQPNISYDAEERNQSYIGAKSVLGITNSFQGKEDKTATSGIAKQISAAQSAGCLESKRRMKNAAYAELFEIMFKLKLAYSDEPRPTATKNYGGKMEYGEFDRYMFLEQDAAGEWYYNDEYTFGVDSTGSLANNREAMWQEHRLNYQQGAFGTPGTPASLLLFWQLMEAAHYPNATQVREQAEEQYKQM